MAVVHSFRLKNGDHELEKILADMTGREKGDFIREALDFYIRYGDKINRIDDIYSGIQEILTRLDGMSFGQSVDHEGNREVEQDRDDYEQILSESVRDLLNL
jgi:predicted DNA-binding protein